MADAAQQASSSSSSSASHLRPPQEARTGGIRGNHPRQSSGVFTAFTAKQIQGFKEAFSLIDQDADGLITRADLEGMLGNLGLGQAPPGGSGIGEGSGSGSGNGSSAGVERLMKAAPLRDGGEGTETINFTQFLTMFGEHLAELDEAHDLIEAFECFDERDEGVIETGEMRYWLSEVGDRMTDKECLPSPKYAPRDIAPPPTAVPSHWPLDRPERFQDLERGGGAKDSGAMEEIGPPVRGLHLVPTSARRQDGQAEDVDETARLEHRRKITGHWQVRAVGRAGQQACNAPTVGTTMPFHIKPGSTMPIIGDEIKMVDYALGSERKCIRLSLTYLGRVVHVLIPRTPDALPLDCATTPFEKTLYDTVEASLGTQRLIWRPRNVDAANPPPVVFELDSELFRHMKTLLPTDSVWLVDVDLPARSAALRPTAPC
ncbi:hypothetical protein OC834_000688 [Tilletia horrida]|nr:hypothetical protein OC834_000688 [Tilletia horrida]